MLKRVWIVVPLLLALVACNRDPNVAKRKYVENGNKYFENGKYKEASIMYRNALKKDQRYGEAYYRLGLTELKQQNVNGAFGAFSRAVELDSENADAAVQLADLYVAYWDNPRLEGQRRDASSKEVHTELQRLLERLQKLAPDSFDSLRLEADFRRVSAYIASKESPDKARAEAAAIPELLERANKLKPHQPRVVLKLAPYLAATKRHQELDTMFWEMLEHNRDNRGLFSFVSLYFHQRGQPEKGEAVLKKAVEYNPKRLDDAILLWAYYRSTNRQDLADKTLAEGIARSDDKGAAEMRAGDVYAIAKDFGRAREHYKRAAEINSKLKAESEVKMAELLIADNKVYEAKSRLEELLKTERDHEQARALHAAIVLDAGTPEERRAAITELETAVAKNPKNWAYRMSLGRAYMKTAGLQDQKTSLERAAMQFEAVKQGQPDNLPARLLLAETNLFRRQYGAAETEAKAVLARPEWARETSAHIALALAMVGQRNVAGARSVLEQALAISPESPQVQYRLNEEKLQQKEFAAAEKGFLALYQSKKDMNALKGLLQSYIAQGQQGKAIGLLESELKAAPDNMTLRQLHAETAAVIRDHDTAINEYKTLLAKYPDSIELMLQLAATYRRKSEDDRFAPEVSQTALHQSIEEFTKAKTKMPKDLRPIYNLAIIYERQGRRDEARRAYQEMLRIRPEDPVALNNLAYLNAQENTNLDEALTMATRAKQLNPDLVEISDTIGWIYLRKGLHDSAAAIYEDLCKTHPWNATYHYRLALALQGRNDKAGAKKAAGQALTSFTSANKNLRRFIEVKEGEIRKLISDLG